VHNIFDKNKHARTTKYLSNNKKEDDLARNAKTKLFTSLISGGAILSANFSRAQLTISSVVRPPSYS